MSACLQRAADAYAIAFVTYGWALNIAYTLAERALRRVVVADEASS